MPEHCLHDRFGGKVDVTRLTDRGRFLAHVTIFCQQCGEPFHFSGVDRQAVPSGDHPTTSLDRTTLRTPIEPKGLILIRGH